MKKVDSTMRQAALRVSYIWASIWRGWGFLVSGIIAVVGCWLAAGWLLVIRSCQLLLFSRLATPNQGFYAL